MNVNQIIESAVEFELEALKTHSPEENPHYFTIMQLKNGEALWEAVNIIVELCVNYRKQYDELERLTNKVCEVNEHMKRTIERQAEEIEDLKQQLFNGKENPMDDLPF